MLRVVAGVVGLALLFWSISFPTFFRSAEAASITSASDTLSDSDLGVAANHTIQFTTPNGVMNGGTILITFDPDFTLPVAGFDFGDLDVTDDGAEITLGSSATGDIWGVATTSTTILLTTSTSSGLISVASSSVLVIQIGTHATSGGTGNSQIANPASAESYEITIDGSMQDSGAFRVVIIDDVVVTASVNTTFTFSVTGVDNGLSVNGTSTSATSTSTTIPFGVLAAGSIKTLAQDITVTTNADNGFAVTVYEGANGLQSSTGADIDGFIDGADTITPSPWQTPTASPSNENSWGHWGLTSTDPDLFGSNLWIAPSTTPRTVFSHNDVVLASTTRVGYQAQISGLQEAGDDYTTTLTYIATPVF